MGKKELHIEKALAVANLNGSIEPKQPFRVYRQGCAMELLCRCKYFEVHRMLLNTERCREMVSYQADGIYFRVLFVWVAAGLWCWKRGIVSSFLRRLYFRAGGFGEDVVA